ncbi:hypothetical protein NMG60_11015678 [Bertholletia excelsa]
MRLWALALLVMMVSSSCLATHRKALAVELDEQEQPPGAENKKGKLGNSDSSLNDNNNHHTIPSHDFNPSPRSSRGGEV